MYTLEQQKANRKTWVEQSPAIPPSEGWYRVMHPGDSESIDGHTIYDFGDYEDWAYWQPADPEEFEDFEGGYKGSWRTAHDEEGDGIFAYSGPFEILTYSEWKRGETA